ncbi:zinc metalloprotease HtpX [Telmatospirillum sp. J64-1]|uniref:zinc metalloprotease HtpX n=1 Tax=Telmatospirillum sp. J64-1 TaxID=2502183 RepID=UPI001C8FA6A6|nr:zinc metalloprotease HtpX [Telmatospirillum sp. J64-1]
MRAPLREARDASPCISYMGAMYRYTWDHEAERRHRRRNVLHSTLLLGGMVALLSACGWIIAGGNGVLMALLAGSLSLILSPRLSPGLVLRLYRAQPIPRWQLPEVHAVLEAICSAAGMTRVPRLHYVPSRIMNAFAVGNRDDAAIAVTDGMLRRLDLRELAGVLAHEVSHIRNDDTWIMGLADTVSRLTRIMSLLGVLLLAFSLPGLILEGIPVPWLLVALLVFAPTLSALLQLALSRTREFAADLDAARLTGDPVGLASALDKLERQEGMWWETILMPGRRSPDPSLLRTHPHTRERIERLLALQIPIRIPTSPVAILLPWDLPPSRRGWRIRRG